MTAAQPLRVLVACEFSGIVRDAFLAGAPIQGFPGYIITECGKVYSCRTNVGFRNNYRALRPSSDAKGYLGLTLCDGAGRRRKARIHRLVAETFLPNPEVKPCVRHIDGNPKNNAVGNLAWGTYVENERDKVGHGTYQLRRTGKMSPADRSAARKMRTAGIPVRDIAKEFGVTATTVYRILSGETWGIDEQ